MFNLAILHVPARELLPRALTILAILRRFLRKNSATGEPLRANMPKSSFQGLTRRICHAYLKDPPKNITGHTGRRSMATIAMQEGMDSLDVAQTTHHKNPATLKQYVDPPRTTLQKASNVLGNVINGKSNEKLGLKRVIDVSCDCLSACVSCVPEDTRPTKKRALETPPKKVKSEKKNGSPKRVPQTPPDQIMERLRGLTHSDAPTLGLLQDAMISGVRMAFDLSARHQEQRANEIRLLLQGLTAEDFDFG